MGKIINDDDNTRLKGAKTLLDFTVAPHKLPYLQIFAVESLWLGTDVPSLIEFFANPTEE